MALSSEKLELTATIVLYKNDIDILRKTIDSFLNIPLAKKLYLVDNSPTNRLEALLIDSQIEYIFLNENIGFGSAHNKIIKYIDNRSKYHLVLNPDVVFESTVVLNLIKTLKEFKQAAMIAPRVLFPNKEHQFSCRRFPSFSELMFRRIGFLKFLFKKKIQKGEYCDKDMTKPFYAEYISGCFQLYHTEDFVAVKGFDERYFMYMEDVDICRKLLEKNRKCLYYPHEVIIHNFEKGSSKNIRLFYYHIKSIFQYFYKWGIAK